MHNDYFPTEYIKDLEYFKAIKVGDHICGRIIDQLYRIKDLDNFINLKKFFICTYELNLITQVVFSHFHLDYEQFIKVIPDYIDCICIYGSNPVNILIRSENLSPILQAPIKYNFEEILFFDKLFESYIKKVIQKNNFKSITWEGITESIKKDPDCNGPAVKSFFKNLK